MVLDAFTAEDIFDTHERNFRMAFALADYFTEEMKNDPRYVKWFARYCIFKNNEAECREIPMHLCKDEDYEKFFPVEERSAEKLNTMRTTPGRGMLCIDWETAGVEFYGTESSGTYSELDVVVMPCNMRNTALGGLDDNISNECVADLAAQIEYMGPMNMQTYYNTERFI